MSVKDLLLFLPRRLRAIFYNEPEIRRYQYRESDWFDTLLAYALIFLIIAVIASVLWGPVTWVIQTYPCLSQGSSSLACKEYELNACLATERHTREECVGLVGGR